jgi:V8-like Glu-specific endopeptidase
MTSELDVVDGHKAVSNQPEEIEPAAADLVEEPSSGEAAEQDAADGVDVEIVAGHQHAETAVAEQWTAEALDELRDIGEASFGPLPALETVHGPDDRVEITNTSAYPWRVHASLAIVAADGSQWIGTGWFIGPHTLITAGHCVFIKNSGVAGRDGWVRSIRVMPGRRGTTLPYGQVTSTSFRSVTGWTDNGDENFDYGAIITPTDLGNTVGWFGFAAYSDAELTSSTVNISGYPGDKPAGTQWYDNHGVASVSSHKVHYDIDTFGGQSGSAVYRLKDGSRYGVAVHAYGGATTNSGTRISTPVYDNLKAWKA